MNKNFRRIAGSVLILLIMYSYALSAAPGKISYQGMLRDADGDPANGQYAFIAAIYDDSISIDPSHMLWQETHVGVNVTDGLFQIILGEGIPPIPVTDAIFAGVNRWIGISVQGEAELAPRTRVCSTPYSQRVQSIDGSTSGLISGNTEIRGEVKSVVGSMEFFMVPRGAIIMWSGPLADIPAGWALCDGTNGTPDFRNRFISACAPNEDPGEIGGSTQHNHYVDPAGGTTSPGDDQYYLDTPAVFPTVWSAYQSHRHTFDPPPGYSDFSDNLPPYYKLAFIMKL